VETDFINRGYKPWLRTVVENRGKFAIAPGEIRLANSPPFIMLLPQCLS
jgi:hypothetical protein